MKSFRELGIEDSLCAALAKKGIERPVPIQISGIPGIIGAGGDLAFSAPTGSGKTLTYLLPLIQQKLEKKDDDITLILAPTHELAVQIFNVLRELLQDIGADFSAALLIGNVNISRQVESLKKDRPLFIVGSPGRVLELIKAKKIKAYLIKNIVIDEADRLLDKNNLSTVEEVIKSTQRDRRILLFSATLGEKEAEKLEWHSAGFKYIKAELENKDCEMVEHSYLICEEREKIANLRKLLAALEPQRALVFVSKGYDLQKMAEKLAFHSYRILSLHGALKKEERKKMLESFRKEERIVLLASDIAARGLDVEDIDYVIGIGFPEQAENYLHRAGRTGRMGKNGKVVSVIAPRELPFLDKTARKYGLEFVKKSLTKGKFRENRRKTLISK